MNPCGSDVAFTFAIRPTNELSNFKNRKFAFVFSKFDWTFIAGGDRCWSAVLSDLKWRGIHEKCTDVR